MEWKVCASGMKWEYVSRWNAMEIYVLVEWRKRKKEGGKGTEEGTGQSVSLSLMALRLLQLTI